MNYVPKHWNAICGEESLFIQLFMFIISNFQQETKNAMYYSCFKCMKRPT